MFCPNCGKELAGSADRCPSCGTPFKKTYNGIAVVGFILWLIPIFTIIPFILSTVGIDKSKKADGKHHGFAVAGATLSGIRLAGIALLFILMLVMPSEGGEAAEYIRLFFRTIFSF